MKIVVLNGSPKGKASNTNIMVTAFLKGAQEQGAETVNIFLAEKNIQHCKGCFSCWLNSPGQCVIKDDMAGTLAHTAGADVLILATPLYFDNISSMLKVFMDRSVVMGDPHMQKNGTEECRHVKLAEMQAPKLMLISNCGFPERSHFQVISHWIKRAALNMHTEVIGEIFATQGGLLANQVEELQPIISNYLHYLEVAGREIATDLKISAETEKMLAQNFLPDEIYVQEANRYFDRVLVK